MKIHDKLFNISNGFKGALYDDLKEKTREPDRFYNYQFDPFCSHLLIEVHHRIEWQIIYGHP